MKRTKGIVYAILVSIPVLFVLFLLATMHILYMLLGVVVVLLILVALKKKKPELFSWLSRHADDPISGNFSQEAAPAPSPAKIRMVLSEKGYSQSRSIKIDKDTFTLGREDSNDYVIDDPDLLVGRHHLRIEYDAKENCCYAVDLKSTNHTYINNNQMEPNQRYRLMQGDRISICDRTFVVEYAHY